MTTVVINLRGETKREKRKERIEDGREGERKSVFRHDLGRAVFCVSVLISNLIYCYFFLIFVSYLLSHMFVFV